MLPLLVASCLLKYCSMFCSVTGHLLGPAREMVASAVDFVMLGMKRMKQGVCSILTTPKKWLHTTSVW